MHGALSFISNVFKTVNEYKNYKDKIEFYKKRIQQLEIVTQNIQSLRQENIRLKEQLNFIRQVLAILFQQRLYI